MPYVTQETEPKATKEISTGKALNSRNELKADKRYTIAKAFIGLPYPVYTVLWCGASGDMLGHAKTKREAVLLAYELKASRNARLLGA